MPIFLASQAPATATEKPSLLEPKVFHRQLRWTRQRFGSGCYVRLHCHALEFLIAKNRERTVQTVIGVAVTFKRRYYLDVETGQYVFLLDELLGLPKEKQISPALTEVAVMLGVSG